jgi:hypothetical protein
MILDNSQIKSGVLRSLEKALQPSLNDISIEWISSQPICASPSKPFYAFNGDRVSFNAVLHEGPVVFRVKYNDSIDGQTKSIEFSNDLSQVTEGRAAVVQAVRGVVGTPQEVELAVRYSVLTKDTSLIAVSTQENASGEAPRRVKVALNSELMNALKVKETPSVNLQEVSVNLRLVMKAAADEPKTQQQTFDAQLQQAQRYSQAQLQAMERMASPMAVPLGMPHIPQAYASTAPPPLPSVEFGSLPGAPCPPSASLSSLMQSATLEETKEPRRPSASTSASSGSPVEVLTELISLQNPDGSWSPSPALEALLLRAYSIELAQVQQTQAALSADVCTTALICAVLAEKLSDHEDTWRLVVVKATRWLKKQGAHKLSLAELAA